MSKTKRAYSQVNQTDGYNFASTELFHGEKVGAELADIANL